MSRSRIPIEKIRQIYLMKWQQGYSNRRIANECSIARSSVSAYLYQAGNAHINLERLQVLNNSELYDCLLQANQVSGAERPTPNWKDIFWEIKKEGRSLKNIWQQYQSNSTDGLRYSRFCGLYSQWSDKLDPVFTQKSKLGQKMDVDYASQPVGVVNRETGEVFFAQIFLAALRASSMSYCEASWTMGASDFINSTIRSFSFFNGSPKSVVLGPKAQQHETQKNKKLTKQTSTYEELAEYYDFDLIVNNENFAHENGGKNVSITAIEQFIHERLKHSDFFSLYGLNITIAEAIKELNNCPDKTLSVSRENIFHEYEKGTLKILPNKPFEYVEWKTVKVGPNLHVKLNGHYYSVPCNLVTQKLYAKLAGNRVEIFYKQNKVASHILNLERNGYSTNPQHIPYPNRLYGGWSKGRFLDWAASIGTSVEKVTRTLLNARAFPQQAYNSCFALLSLSKHYKNKQIDHACEQALTNNFPTYKFICTFLKTRER